MLSLSDLDEVERWLRGELRPAVRGSETPAESLAGDSARCSFAYWAPSAGTTKCGRRPFAPRRASDEPRGAVFQFLQLVQRVGTVEQLDVACLRRRESAHGPAQMDEVRLDRRHERMHADLLGEPIGLARVAGRARGHDVGPVVGAAARQRDEVVAGQPFARLQLGRGRPQYWQR